jgi:AraC-like DNA-binding protein
MALGKWAMPDQMRAEAFTRAYAVGHSAFPRRVSLKEYPPHWRFQTPDYPERGVQHILEGEMIVRERGREQRLTAGWTLLMFRGGRFELITRNRSCRGFVVFNSTLHVEPVNPGTIALAPNPGLSRLAESITSSLNEAGRFSLAVTLAAGDHLAAYAYHLAVNRFEQPHASAAEWIRITQQLIENHADCNRTLRDILSAVPLSYEHLLRLFKAQMGVSPRAYRIQKRVGIAQKLLLNSQDDITTIAMQLGYSSSQHFATEFRRITGLTPTSFRENPKTGAPA